MKSKTAQNSKIKEISEIEIGSKIMISPDGITPPKQLATEINDDKSTYSKISKISKFTNNLMNKSNNGIND